MPLSMKEVVIFITEGCNMVVMDVNVTPVTTIQQVFSLHSDSGQ